MTCSYAVLSPLVNAPFLYSGRWSKSFLTATLFHNFQNIFQTLEWEQRKLVFTRFNLENILSSLALENGTVNNNLINNSTSLKPLLLDVLKVLRQVTIYETLARERIFFSFSSNPYQCSKRSEIDTFIPASFNGIRNCAHVEKIKLFCIQCFFFCCCCLFANDDVKPNNSESYFCRVFRYKCFCK